MANLLSSGLYRRPRSFTGSCAGDVFTFRLALAGFTAGRELANFFTAPCPEGYSINL